MGKFEKKFQFQIKSEPGFYWSPEGWKKKDKGYCFDYMQDAVWIANLLIRPKFCKNCNCDNKENHTSCKQEKKQPPAAYVRVVSWEEKDEQ